MNLIKLVKGSLDINTLIRDYYHVGSNEHDISSAHSHNWSSNASFYR